MRILPHTAGNRQRAERYRSVLRDSEEEDTKQIKTATGSMVAVLGGGSVVLGLAEPA